MNKGKTTYGNSVPTCPYCGYEEVDWFEGVGETDFWQYEEYNCTNCEKKYYLERVIEWNSKPSCKLNNEECELEDMIVESKYKECTKCEELK